MKIDWHEDILPHLEHQGYGRLITTYRWWSTNGRPGLQAVTDWQIERFGRGWPKEFADWIARFIDEKKIDTDRQFIIPIDNSTHIVDFSAVIEGVMSASWEEQQKIKDTLVKIDFSDGDPMHFFGHLAGALARMAQIQYLG